MFNFVFPVTTSLALINSLTFSLSASFNIFSAREVKSLSFNFEKFLIKYKLKKVD